MKAHLHGLLTRMAEHHIAAGKHHVSLARAHRELVEDGEAHATIADSHEELASEHAAMGKECVKRAKALHSEPAHKAAGMHDDSLLPLPDGFTAILPDHPGNTRAVVRAGGPPLPQLAGLDPGLQKLFSVDEGEQL